MYFATVSAVRIPVWLPHMEAEERLISSVCVAMISSSCLFQLHQEGLVLRRPGVRVARPKRSGNSPEGRCVPRRPHNPSAAGSRSATAVFRRSSSAGGACVTMATPSIEPRADVTRTCEPFVIPFSCCELFRDLHEEARLKLVEHATRCAWSSSGTSRSGGRSCRRSGNRRPFR